MIDSSVDVLRYYFAREGPIWNGNVLRGLSRNTFPCQIGPSHAQYYCNTHTLSKLTITNLPISRHYQSLPYVTSFNGLNISALLVAHGYNNLLFTQDSFHFSFIIFLTWRATWRKRLDARLPPLGSRVRVSVTPCGFRGGRNGAWVDFSRGFPRFPLPQISFHYFSTLTSSILFHQPLWWCDRRGRPAPFLVTDL